MNLEQKIINTLRSLSVDTIQKANSGHPGIALGAAPVVYTLFAKHLKHNPKNSKWQNRDRFILSAGHGSALLYSLLHLFGYNISIEDLKNFRTLGSKTPGHPEYGHTDGIEVTTGPLGQGIANAVGMAISEVHLASKFNRENFPIIDNYTYVLCGDGCLMEGISYEAMSLAGALKLNKLIVLYDSNNISIEGDTDLVFKEDVIKRFEAFGFYTQFILDGNDTEQIYKAIENAKKSDKPSFIQIKTTIGYGAPNKAGTASAHGEPLGQEEIKAFRQNLNIEQKDFFVPDDVKLYMDNIIKDLTKKEEEYINLLNNYKLTYPALFEEYEKYFSDNFIDKLLDDDTFWNYNEDMATRQSSALILNKISKIMPNLLGGAADLAPSTKTIMQDRTSFSDTNRIGSNMHFGVREHAMAAIANGIALYGGLRPYIAGFFVFSDYLKPALRLSALMKLPVISIFTHDSIGVGEDGPTHQPIEQLASLRSIPNYTVIRPCDTNETAAAYYLAIKRKISPTSIILTRQTTKQVGDGKKALKGGYIIKDYKNIDLIIIATGSEVAICIDASEILAKENIFARVVSMPSFEIFDEQSEEYKNSVLPKNITKRIGVEAAVSFGWHKYIGLEGALITIDTFGESAPFKKLFEKYGFTAENVVKQAKNILER